MWVLCILLWLIGFVCVLWSVGIARSHGYLCLGYRRRPGDVAFALCWPVSVPCYLFFVWGVP